MCGDITRLKKNKSKHLVYTWILTDCWSWLFCLWDSLTMASPGYHLKWILTLIWCDGFCFSFFYHFFSSLFLCVLEWNVNFTNPSSAMPMPSCMLFGFDHAIHYPLHVRIFFFHLFLHFSLLLFISRVWICWGEKSNCITIVKLFWISREHMLMLLY